MIKVVCIDNTIGNARHLELNKVYDASEISQTHSKYSASKYYSINTYPYEGALFRRNSVRYATKHDIWIDKRSFISLEEFRQLKLDKILNNEI
jgi:hypothetical protein